jgi:hypothetical protein
MEMAIWLASIFGPYLLIKGLWALLYNENFQKITTAVKNSPAVFYMVGCLCLLLGLGVLSRYHTWAGDLTFFVTLLGWVMVLRGIFSLFIPQMIVKLFMTNHAFLKLQGIIPLVWGILLCALAFAK